MPDAATADDLGFVPHTQSAGNDLGFVPHTQQAPIDLGFVPVGRIQQPPSSTPATDDATDPFQGTAPNFASPIEERAKAFVQNLGIPYSPESLKEAGKFLIRSPVQDIKDIGTALYELPGKIANIGQTVQTSPAATVARAPLSPEAFGVYGTAAGLLIPAIERGLRGVEPSVPSQRPGVSGEAVTGVPEPGGGPIPPSGVQGMPVTPEVPVVPEAAAEAAQVQGTPEMARVQPEVIPATEAATVEPTGAATATPEAAQSLDQALTMGAAGGLERHVVLVDGSEHMVAPFAPIDPDGSIALANGNSVDRAVIAKVLDENKNEIPIGEQYASSQPSAASVPEPAVRAPVGEGPPLRQQGQTPVSQGDVGGGTAEPPPQEAPVSEQAPIGVAERYAQAEMPGSVTPGTRQDASYWKAKGREYINQGGDPRMPIRAADAGHVSPRNVGIVSAEHERLVLNRRAAADALEANPRDPVAQKNYEAADAAARAWRQEMQPVLTRAGESLGAAIGQEQVDLGTFDGLHEAAMEANGGQPLTIAQKADLMKRAGKAREYRQAEAKANGARDEVLNKTLPKTKPLTPPEMLDMVERMKARMTPCR